MGKMQRDKGKAFELKVANLLKEYGYDTHRSARF